MDIDYSIQYAKWNDDSDAHYAKTADWYMVLLHPVLSGTAKDAVVLDVGCGTGLLVNTLLRGGFKNVRGIDLSPQQAKVAQQRNLPCALVNADYIYELADSAPGSLDLIFLLDVLEHIPVAEHMRFVSCLSRLLKPGARLVLTVPNANSTFAMRWRYIDWTHQCAFTEHGVEFVALNQGFQNVQFLPFEFGTPLRFPFVHQPSFWTAILKKAVRLLRRVEAIGELGRQGFHIPLGLNLLAVCRKAE